MCLSDLIDNPIVAEINEQEVDRFCKDWVRGKDSMAVRKEDFADMKIPFDKFKEYTQSKRIWVGSMQALQQVE